MPPVTVNLNHNNSSVMLNIRRFLRAVHEDTPAALLMVGAWTSSAAVRAVFTAPPEWVLTGGHGNRHAYYMAAVAVSFVGGVATMWAAVWLSTANAARGRGVGGRPQYLILCAALVLLVVALGLSGADLIFNA